MPARWPSSQSRRATSRSSRRSTQHSTALESEFDALELRSLFTGEHDERDAAVEIHAGEGGTDAQDWAEMMLRMYLRWAERRGFGSSSTR